MPEPTLERVRIILVEPAGARNVGAIARVMKNFGLSRLVLVNPQCEHLSAEARQMAVHAGDVLETAKQVATLPEALTGCQRAIATTARVRTLPTELKLPKTGLHWLLEHRSPEVHSALIFGPEDRGLSNDELNYAQRFVRIPSNAVYSSLNLAQAVAICCYELSLAGQEVEDRSGGVGEQSANYKPQVSIQLDAQDLISNPALFASLDELEGYYQQLEAVLLKIGYLYPHTSNSRMEKFRRLFNRADLSITEVAMLRGILSQVEWALETNSKDDR